ncbi:MAG: urease accessory protein UreH [Bacteroidota bacterium]
MAFVQTEVFTILSLGFILGLRHALDADHLIAVSTIVSGRKGIFSSSLVGAMWGIGHTAALLVIGLIVIALQIQITERVALAMEFGVAAMLVILGLNLLWKLYNGEMIHVHVHEHHGHQHIHPHIHPFKTPHEHSSEPSHHESTSSKFLQRLLSHVAKSKRSILIGMVHGMAGSAALMLIVLATIQSTTLALLYIAIFGFGSIGGMMLMSTVIGLPFMLTADKSLTLNRIVRGIAGVTSVLFGLFLGWQIGVVEGLFIPR